MNVINTNSEYKRLFKENYEKDNYLDAITYMKEYYKNKAKNNLIKILNYLLDLRYSFTCVNYDFNTFNLDKDTITNDERNLYNLIMKKQYANAYNYSSNMINSYNNIYDNELMNYINDAIYYTMKDYNDIKVNEALNIKNFDIHKSLDNNEYDFVFLYLSIKINHQKLSLFEITIYRLLLVLNKNKIKYSSYKSKTNEYDIPKKFADAINNKNYAYAYENAIIMYEKNNNQDFKYYANILKMINEKIKFQKDNSFYDRKQKEINLVFKDINICLNKKHVSMNDLDDLCNHFNKLYELYDILGYNQVDIDYLYNIVDVIKTCRKEHVTREYFEQFTYDNKDILDMLFDTLNNGDYTSAAELVKNLNLEKENTTNYYYLIALKKLLILFNTIMNKNEYKALDKNVYTQYINDIAKDSILDRFSNEDINDIVANLFILSKTDSDTRKRTD